MTQNAPGALFALFNEIGIINQLSSAMMDQALPDGLISPHFGVLNHLIRVRDGGTPLQLARAFQVPKTSMTHTLAGLEKHGLVTMKPNPQDARSKQVWLTDKGRAVREETIARLAPQMRAAIGDADLGALLAALPALIDLRQRLDAARDKART